MVTAFAIFDENSHSGWLDQLPTGHSCQEFGFLLLGK